MSQRRYELTDFEWLIIEPLLPNKPRGKPRVDDRRLLNGIYWRLRTGSPWGDIPERYGPPTTCSNRFRRWALARWIDDQDPRTRRCRRPAGRPRAHRGPSPRRTQRRRHASDSRRRSHPARRPRLRQRRIAQSHGRSGRVGEHHARLAARQYTRTTLRRTPSFWMLDRRPIMVITPIGKTSRRRAFAARRHAPSFFCT